MFYRWTRDLHLYFGLFISPFVLLFAASVFYLNHGKLIVGTPPAETYQNLHIPEGFDRLKGREAVARAREILPQVEARGEIGFVRYVAKDRHLIVPVSRGGTETTIDVDLDARSAMVTRRRTGLWESLAYLHKIPGPHNVAIRGNWVGTQAWRWFADATCTWCSSFRSAASISGGRSPPSAESASFCSPQAQPRSSGSCMPLSARLLEAWNRRLHYYLGLYFLFFLWLFSATGLMLNHQQWFSDLYQRTETTYDTPIETPAGESILARTQDLMRQLDLTRRDRLARIAARRARRFQREQAD